MPDAEGRRGTYAVSAVIPTRSRPRLLARALDSVASQTFEDLEVVVVVDGPDDETVELLRGWTARPLTVIANERSLGGGEARNVGIHAARGRWIGLLDDDDEWLPRKLERQVADLERLDDDRVIGMTQLITRSPHADYVGPTVGPREGEPVSEYLFLRSGWVHGGGRAQTSTLVAPRALFLQVPFDASLPRYQDTDWLLRACAAGATLHMTPEPLSIWYVEEGRAGITSSHAGDWRFALDWIRARRDLMTRRAYVSLVVLRVGGMAATSWEPRGAIAALREARRVGRPRVRDVAIVLGKFLLPAGVRRWLRVRLAGVQRRPA
jgi:glycosyltransferase involved in cell wall biosynthesis